MTKVELDILKAWEPEYKDSNYPKYEREMKVWRALTNLIDHYEWMCEVLVQRNIDLEVYAEGLTEE